MALKKASLVYGLWITQLLHQIEWNAQANTSRSQQILQTLQ